LNISSLAKTTNSVIKFSIYHHKTRSRTQ